MPSLNAPDRGVSKGCASPRLAMALLPVLAGTAFVSMSPAQAQYYVRPFGGVYVERYYEPLPPPPPVYYGAPPIYSEPGYRPPVYRSPAYRAPGRFPYADIQPMLRSMGMSAIGRPRTDGDTYVVEATDGRGARVRVRIDAFNGRVIAMHPIGGSPVARQSVPPAPSVAPLPPKKPPELAAVTAPGAPVAEPPGAAPAVESTVPPDPASPVPDSAPAAASEPDNAPAAAAPATPPATEAAPAQAGGDNIRVIPGIAVPPGSTGAAPPKSPPPPDQQAKAAPAPEKVPEAAPASDDTAAGSGTGTGTGTGSDTPAGTASVMARGAGKPGSKPAAPVED